ERGGWVWISGLAFSRLAYLAGTYLIFKYDPNLKAGFAIDRRSAVEAAARFAASKGIDVTGWDSLCRVKTSDNLLFYYRLDKGRERNIARNLAPEVAVGVRLKSPDHLETLEVELGPDGRPLGYTRYFSSQREVGPIDQPAARRLAVEAVKSRLTREGVTADVAPILEEKAETGAVIRNYKWKWPLTTIPELTVNSEISFRGGVLVGDTVKATVDSGFAKSKLNSGSTLKTSFGVAYVLLVIAGVIFGLYQFVQRVKQQEISYSRIAMVAAIFAAGLALFILLTDVA